MFGDKKELISCWLCKRVAERKDTKDWERVIIATGEALGRKADVKGYVCTKCQPL